MRILITGGAGFIGSHTAEALLARGHDVRLLDSLEPPVHIGGWPDYLPAEFERVRGDVRDPDAVAKALAGVDVVYHLAAYQDYLPDFSRFINVNAASTALIYEVIVSQGLPVRKVIVASSQAVLGEGLYHCPNDGPILPDSRSREQLEAAQWDLPCPRCQAVMTPVPSTELVGNPQNPYGISKQCQERIAIHLGRRYGIPTVALRYSIVQGPRQSFRNAYSGACRVFSLSCHQKQQPIVYEDGRQLRDFVNIQDVVAANLLVLDRPEADYQIFHVGGGTHYTVLQFAQIVAEAYGMEFHPVMDGRFRFGDTRHAISDISAIRALGWQPQVPAAESVRQYREWLLSEVPATDIVGESQARMKKLGVIGYAVGSEKTRSAPPGKSSG
jgi:dTDP-L-rhamnose 4-epimerase